MTSSRQGASSQEHMDTTFCLKSTWRAQQFNQHRPWRFQNRSKIDPRASWTLLGRPRAAQKLPKSSPIAAQVDPRSSQDGSKRAQEYPKRLQERPKSAQERAKSLQRGRWNPPSLGPRASSLKKTRYTGFLKVCVTGCLFSLFSGTL